MSKVRIPINPIQVGRVGAYSMYVRNGEQIVRQRNNSSNYGDSASRTEAQMLRRVKWANLVNFYKASAFWMPKAFENKKSNQTMYNAFMAANINQSTVALTKQLAEEGCCVCEALQVSKGTLPSLSYQYFESSHYLGTGLQTNAAITGTTTVGELSAGIIATMRDFQNGDNIAWVKYVQTLNRDSEQNLHPRLLCLYDELTLDTSSSVLLSAHPLAKYFETVGASFSIQVGDATDLAEDSYGYALIHTRRDSSLKVSSQIVAMISDALTEEFTSQAWIQDCIDSYGVDTEVPLDPSFNPATAVRVTFNGSQIWQSGQRRTFIDASEGGELVLQGNSLDSSKCWVTFLADGASQAVRYTPLWVDSDGWHYLLTSNGHATVIINKYVECGVTLEGIEIPTGFPTRIAMMKVDPDRFPSQARALAEHVDGVCLQYPVLYNAENLYYRLDLRALTEAPVQADFEPVNATITDFGSDSTTPNCVLLSVTDTAKPAYLYYQGVIIAVFNYSA